VVWPRLCLGSSHCNIQVCFPMVSCSAKEWVLYACGVAAAVPGLLQLQHTGDRASAACNEQVWHLRFHKSMKKCCKCLGYRPLVTRQLLHVSNILYMQSLLPQPALCYLQACNCLGLG
jgi:hypothetical protein